MTAAGGPFLDRERTEAGRWAAPVVPLGVGRLAEVDTTDQVDVPAIAARVRAA